VAQRGVVAALLGSAVLWCGARWAVSGESKTSQDTDGVARSRGAVAGGVEWHSDGEFVVLVANVGPGLLAKGYMERAERAALGLDWLSARHGTAMETMEARCTHGAEDLATLAPILATIPGSNYGGRGPASLQEPTLLRPG
jgi:hypothetical protein